METVWKGVGLKGILNHITYQKANLTVFISQCILKTIKIIVESQTFISYNHSSTGYLFTMMIVYNDNAVEL